MTNKTPYELRFEILQMARDLVERKYEMQNNVIENQLHTAVSNGQDVSISDLKNAFKETPSEEIIKKAKELYEFVLEK